jgi:hypothetical protein
VVDRFAVVRFAGDLVVLSAVPAVEALAVRLRAVAADAFDVAGLRARLDAALVAVVARRDVAMRGLLRAAGASSSTDAAAGRDLVALPAIMRRTASVAAVTIAAPILLALSAAASALSAASRPAWSAVWRTF